MLTLTRDIEHLCHMRALRIGNFPDETLGAIITKDDLRLGWLLHESVMGRERDSDAGSGHVAGLTIEECLDLGDVARNCVDCTLFP